MKKLIIPAILLMTTSAFAQNVANLDFAGVDTDKSGGISFNELEIAIPGYTQERFDALDVNSDGQLDETEYANLAAEQSDSSFSTDNDTPDDASDNSSETPAQ